jgi:hypothetical protein
MLLTCILHMQWHEIIMGNYKFIVSLNGLYNKTEHLTVQTQLFFLLLPSIYASLLVEIAS